VASKREDGRARVDRLWQCVATFKPINTVGLIDDVDTQVFWWVTGTVIMISAHQRYCQHRMTRTPLRYRGQCLRGMMHVGRM